MRCVLLHYHIFKNAGTTIEEALERSFGAEFSRIETPNSEGLVYHPDILRFLDQNPRVKAISSHQIRHPVPAAPGFLFLDVCILRHPVDRVRSIYDFYHSRPAPGDPLSDLAQGSMGAFVAGLVRTQQLHIKNVQVNLLACFGDSDEPEEKDLLVALDRVRGAAFPGVVDCFNRSMVAAEYSLRPIFPELDCARPAENVTGGLVGDLDGRIAKVRAACDQSDYSELLRLNALDLRLLDSARVEVERRFRAIPDGGERLQEFERRISMAPAARALTRMPRQTATPPVASQPPASAPPAKASWLTRLRRLAASPVDAFLLRLAWRRYGVNLFDAEYYRTTYPEIGSANPFRHFLLGGAFEGKKPHPLFDPAFYSGRYPDVAGANPLIHYLKRGHWLSRQPNAFFDPAFYLDHNPDVRATGIPPLLHYLAHGAAEGRKPHRLFQPEYYARNCAGIDVGASGLLSHFAESGPAAASPHPLFDCPSYLAKHPDAMAQGLNPLAHYLALDPCRAGWQSAADWQPAHDHLPVAEFTVADVPVAVVFLGDGWVPGPDSPPPNAARISAPTGSLVLISKDASGAVRMQAEPQQQPFFDAIPAGQLYAQVNAWLTPG